MNTSAEDVVAPAPPPRGRGARVLDWFERVGNRFPDPIVLFLVALAATWAASSLLAEGRRMLRVPRGVSSASEPNATSPGANSTAVPSSPVSTAMPELTFR